MARVAQLVGHSPAKRKVAGSIPGQGTCLGCGYSPHLEGGGVSSNQSMFLLHQCFSPSFFLSLPLSKINKIFLQSIFGSH